jgi:hypothetical protein
MILKKQEKDNVVKAMYASSNICASTYNKTNKDLIIIFNNGGQYKYANVSETDYTRFEIADSQGVVFNSHIKKYDFEKLDKTDVSQILTEVTSLKEAEQKQKEAHVAYQLAASLQAVSVYYDTTQSIDPALYAKLKTAMDNYENVKSNTAVAVNE